MSSIELESASETKSDRHSSGNEEYQIKVEASDCVLHLMSLIEPWQISLTAKRIA